MKDRFPGFKQCLRLMRKHNGQTQEDGFQWLLPHASKYVPELIEEFKKEKDPRLRCWLVELIGSAKSPEAFAFFAEQMRSPEEGVQQRDLTPRCGVVETGRPRRVGKGDQDRRPQP